MAKFLNQIKPFIAILSIVLFVTGNVVAVDGMGVEDTSSKLESVNPGPGTELGNTEQQVALDADSLKSADRTAGNGKKGTDGQTKVKKSENASPSIFSYNFVFYLMYKFKIADIFNISKEKNTIAVPNESSLIANGKRLVNKMIHRIAD